MQKIEAFSFREKPLSLLILSTAALLSACGGGDSSNDTQQETNAAPTVVNTAPTVVIDGQTTAISEMEISLTANAQDSDGQIVQYQWSQLSGQPVSLQSSNEKVATFVAPEANGNPISLRVTVTDDGGLSTSADISLTVEPKNIEPMINVESEQHAAPQDTIVITPEISDSDGSISVVTWTQTSGAPLEFTQNSDHSITFIAPEPQLDPVKFEISVSDNKGATSTASASVIIEPIHPKNYFITRWFKNADNPENRTCETNNYTKEGVYTGYYFYPQAPTQEWCINSSFEVLTSSDQYKIAGANGFQYEKKSIDEFNYVGRSIHEGGEIIDHCSMLKANINPPKAEQVIIYRSLASDGSPLDCEHYSENSKAHFELKGEVTLNQQGYPISRWTVSRNNWDGDLFSTLFSEKPEDTFEQAYEDDGIHYATSKVLRIIEREHTNPETGENHITEERQNYYVTYQYDDVGNLISSSMFSLGGDNEIATNDDQQVNYQVFTFEGGVRQRSHVYTSAGADQQWETLEDNEIGEVRVWTYIPVYPVK